MTSLSRRQLLKGGLAAAGAALAGGTKSGVAGGARHASTDRWIDPVVRRRPGSLPFPKLPPGTDTMPEIEHIIVLMMENHSYDNHLGMLGRSKGQRPRGDGFTIGVDGQPVNSNPTGTGKRQLVFPMPSDCQNDKPDQDWLHSHLQYDGGTNEGFVTSGVGPTAMGYWDQRQLPFYYSLAATFPLSDRWFCSLLGQTDPNRRYLVAATSAGMVDDLISQIPATPPNGTIFDRLDHYGISWRDYYHTTSSPTVAVWLKDASATSKNVVSVDAFFTDAAAGTLPSFCIVDPEYNSGSEENPQDIAIGEAFAAQVVNALTQSPAWDRSLLVWNFDEHGGYYDHVPPPPAIAPDSIPPMPPAGESLYDGFRRYGFRVPAVVVSPYGRRDHVSHVVHDHTSILAMVERKWNLPALTYRDANAADLTDFLDLARPGFREPPGLAKPALEPQACTPGNPGGPIPPPGSTLPATLR